VEFEGDEAYLSDAHISHYSHGNRMNHEETRRRKLLMHRKEIEKFRQKAEEKGMTVIPLKMYFKGQHIKVELGLGKGKKLHDKRESAKTKDANRDMQRMMRAKRG